MAGPPQRQRFNAKARQSTAGGSSHKKRRNNPKALTGVASEEGAGASTTNTVAPDANREIIVPESKEEQEWREREKQRRQLLAAANSDPNQKLSAKKRKRLDAYIASRLKKEARAELLEELAKSSAQVRDGRFDLASARTLGSGKVITAREIVEGKSKDTGADDDEDSDDDDDDESMGGAESVDGQSDGPQGEVPEDPERRRRILEAASLFGPTPGLASSTSGGPSNLGSALAPGSISLGGALAKGADGLPVAPTMRKRKRKGLSQRERKRLRDKQQQEEQQEEGDSSGSESSDFDSSDSSDDDQTSKQKKTVRVVEVPEPSKAAAAAPADEEDNRATDSEEEAVLLEAMRRRGMALPSEDEDDDDDDDDDDKDDRFTDSEEEIVLLEAMRRRGMALPSEDEDEESSSDSEADGGDEDLAQKDSKDDGNDGAASPVWEGFASEDDADGSSSGQGDNDDDEGDSESGEGSDDDDDDEGDEDEDSSGSEDEAIQSRRCGITKSTRSSGFKDWARNALGFGASEGSGEAQQGRTEEGAPLEPVAGIKVRVRDMGDNDGVARGPLGEKEVPPSELSPFAAKYYAEVASSKAIRNVVVQRSPEVIELRLKLPVVQEEERLVRTIVENETTVICGETGSGKTTQVAQMLFERGFGTPGSDNPGLVGITQPRRVAAVSTARRVAEELNLPPNRVSHQIRYDGTVSPQTSLKFMTDGVLLRELAGDLLLNKYSVVIVDEAHERSVNTDVLIGMLSRVVRLRASRWLEGKEGARPLRLIIMSATLRVADFVENPTLFPKPPPLLRIEARQHPVSVHFNRRTPHDYLEEAVKKASKIHTRLPPGGILVFLTGEQEIRTVCKQLEAKFGRKQIEARRQRKRQRASHRGDDGEQGEDSKAVQFRVRPEREDVEAEEVTLGVSDEQDLSSVDQQGETDSGGGNGAEHDAEALDTDDEDGDDGDDDAPTIEEDAMVPMHILPLYSLLPSEKQLEVFKPPPEDSRLVVVATNVAETSLTIPNVRYVIDCGRAKERKYDGQSGISSFKVDWISKASAAQRAGRAGRTGPGHCYRLYSSNVFEEYCDEFAEAEIRRTPVEGLVLQMKSMNIDNVINFPFPTAPDRAAIAKAERILTRLGALAVETDPKTRRDVARITELGRTMSLFPLNPRFAKLLVQGQQHGCLPFIVALVAAMSVGDLFVREEHAAEGAGDDDDAADIEEAAAVLGDENLKSEAVRRHEARKARRRKRYETLAKFDSLGGPGVSDAFRILAVVGAYAYAGGSTAFCHDNFLRPKAMEEVRLLRSQLASLVLSTLAPSAETSALADSLNSPRLSPPSETQLKVLRQLIACAYIDQVAVRADLAPEAARSVPALADLAVEGRLKGKWRTCRYVPYLAMGVAGDAAYVHPSSALFEHTPPEWCVFSEVTRSRPKDKDTEGGQDANADDDAPQQGRVYLRGLTKINPNWIAKIGKNLCSFSKPVPLDLSASSPSATLASKLAALKQAKNRKDGSSGSDSGPHAAHEVTMTPTYGTGPACEPSERATMVGWELPPVRATRRWVGGKVGWDVDVA